MVVTSTQTKSPRLGTHTFPPQTRPTSADVYKNRLLAYATTAADQLSSAGEDEVFALQQWRAQVDDDGTNDELGDSGEFMLSAQGSASDFPRGVLPLFGNIAGELAQQQSRSSLGVDPLAVYQAPNEPHRLDPIAEASCEASDEGLHDSDNFDPADTGYLDDWEDEPHSESTEDEFEESGILAPEYEVMQAEEDELAVSEPLDESDVGGTPAASQDNTMATPQTPQTNSNPVEPLSRNPKISPFPMSVSHRTSNQEATKRHETMAKLSPKFASQPTRHMRPSPFAALLKSRREQASNIEVESNQVEREDVEDDIESWPG
jgi:hypothetical protein